jgi:integrase
MATKRAKIIEDKDFDKVILFIDRTSRYPIRDKLAFMLTVKAGMRATEVALMRWECVVKSDGQVNNYIEIFSDMTKKKKERLIPLSEDLKKLLKAHLPQEFHLKSRVIKFGTQSRRNPSHAMVVWLGRLYETTGLRGCTSHSGRRTFITKAARVVNNYGCSLVDVQKIVGHSRLDTTQSYIEPSPNVVSLVNAI